MNPECVIITVYDSMKRREVFKITHPLQVFGFDSFSTFTRQEITTRVRALINAIDISGMPTKDFSM